MKFDVALSNVLAAAEKILSYEDMSIVFEALSHNEIGIAIEFICDKLDECGCILPESLGFNLQFIATKLHLDPIKSWENLIIEEQNSHQLKRIFREGSDVNGDIERIVQEVHNQLTIDAIRDIQEYLDYDETDLAIDALCYELINGKIEISKNLQNKIQTILLDLGRGPNEWKGFLVKEG